MPDISYSLLAFGLAGPAFLLGGILLGGIPILIHLLHKRRYKEASWAAMRFLLAATKKNSSRIRLEQMILLAVRVLIFVLLGAALARPYFSSLQIAAAENEPVHRIFVIDTSYSMGIEANNESRLARCKSEASNILRLSQQGDAWNLVQICETSNAGLIQQAAYRKGIVQDEIDKLSLTDEPGKLARSLIAAKESLATAPDIDQKQIIILSDMQTGTWQPDDANEKALIRELMEELSASVDVQVIDVGTNVQSNVQITSFSADDVFVTTSQPARFQAELRSHHDAKKAVPVEFHVNGKLAKSWTVDLPGGGATSIDWRHAFRETGEHRLELRVGEDALTIDNRRRLVYFVRDQFNVLLVNGRRSNVLMGNATDHLELALSPRLKASPWDGLLQPQVISEGELIATDLAIYDCLFLCNVGLLTQREVDLLESYTSSGGGVVFSLGERIQTENYNQLLYRDGIGLLPARLKDMRDKSQNDGNAFEFQVDDYRHPIVKPFEGNPDAGLETSRVDRYIRTEIEPRALTETVIQFANGNAALLDRSFGQGRVVLITTSLDREWGTWAVWPSFPPIMQEVVLHAATGQLGSRQLQVGTPVYRVLEREVFDFESTMIRPDGQSNSIPNQNESGVADVRYNRTDKAGFYELQLGAPLNRSEWFAVNVDPKEGQLDRITEADLRNELTKEIEFGYSTQWTGRRQSNNVFSSSQGVLSRWLLYAGLSLILIELLMAWEFRYGMVALYLAIAGACLFQTVQFHFMGGLLVMVMLITGLYFLLRLLRPAIRTTAAK